eukprot:scaffold158613_cov34-Prasinocladus_malaysianus.AAC.1
MERPTRSALTPVTAVVLLTILILVLPAALADCPIPYDAQIPHSQTGALWEAIAAKSLGIEENAPAMPQIVTVCTSEYRPFVFLREEHALNQYVTRKVRLHRNQQPSEPT